MSNIVNWQWILFYLLVAYTKSSHQISTPASKSYIAAVVEFAPNSVSNNSKLTIESNLAEYEKLILNASQQNADIIVFPEDGLTTYHLPERSHMESWSTVIPSALHTPCTQDMDGVTETLKKISCAAKNNKIYVVINTAERAPCYNNECPKGESLYYNSNVVFDRNGTIIAKYRKQNLFVEPQFTIPRRQKPVTFETDFGVTFGTFICFDILFSEPSIRLTRELGITDIVFTTAWFSETPFLTAIQTQYGWSFAENVNLLAAGYNDPLKGNSGSGIYCGHSGIKNAILPRKQTTQLIVEEVPKKLKKPVLSNQEIGHQHYQHSHMHDELRKKRELNNANVHDELRKKRDVNNVNDLKLLRDNISSYETEVLNGNVSGKTLCYRGHCCDFTIKLDKIDTKIKYRLVVYSGIRNFADVSLAAIRVCGIVQCSNDTLESCGSTLDSQTTFKEISISGTFDDSLNSLIMPDTLKTDLMPITSLVYEEHSHDDHKHVTIATSNITDLLTFGVYCRDFDSDPVSTATSNNISYLFSILMTFLLVRFW